MDFELKPIKTPQDVNSFKNDWLTHLQHIDDTWQTGPKKTKLVNAYTHLFDRMVVPMYRMVVDGSIPKESWEMAISALHKKLVKSKPLYKKILCYKARLDLSLGIDSKELQAVKNLVSTNTPLTCASYSNVYEIWAYFNFLELRNFPRKKATGVCGITATKLANVVPKDINGVVDKMRPLPGLIAGLDTGYFKNAMGESSYLNYLFDYNRYVETKLTKISYTYVPVNQAKEDLLTWMEHYAVTDLDKLNMYVYCMTSENRISGTLSSVLSLEENLLPYLKSTDIKSMIQTCISLQIDDIHQIHEMILTNFLKDDIPTSLPDLNIP